MLVVSQTAFALAPSYGVVLVARLVGALAHGVFWSVIAQVAANLVSRDRMGRATAAVFAGNSVALVAGHAAGQRARGAARAGAPPSP